VAQSPLRFGRAARILVFIRWQMFSAFSGRSGVGLFRHQSKNQAPMPKSSGFFAGNRPETDVI
jgi:hypothetical protein